MPNVTCPECGYVVGLGVASEPGHCPSCEVPLMLTCEMRVVGADEGRVEPDPGANGHDGAASLL